MAQSVEGLEDYFSEVLRDHWSGRPADLAEEVEAKNIMESHLYRFWALAHFMAFDFLASRLSFRQGFGGQGLEGHLLQGL